MMKKIYIYLLCAVSCMVSFTSCEDLFGGFLDKQPSNELTEEEVFSSWLNTRAFYYDIYNYLRDGKARIQLTWMDSATDLAESSYARGTRTSFNIGNYYASSGANELTETWTHYWRAIRKCNMVLERIDDVPMDADETVESRALNASRIKAECRFFRAYFLWELCLRYGAVPIIEDILDPEDNEAMNSLQRPASVATCFSYILRELSACYSDLLDDANIPEAKNVIANADQGHITKGINMAFQSRIKLYLASPLYVDLGLSTWRQAADAAKEFIDTWGEGVRYRLYAETSDPVANYMRAIIRPVEDTPENNPEVIFWKNGGSSYWWAEESPVGYGGYGGLTPSQNLVDMYDMSNGLSPFASYDETGAPVYNSNLSPDINSSAGYSDQNPYADRDARLSATVLYNGAQWWNRPIDTTDGGTDNPNGNAYATSTGYYNRKYMDDSQTHYLTGGSMFRNWIFIRYAEILLNYAEALNEAGGSTTEIFAALEKLRTRAGINGNLAERSDLQTREGRRKFIRKERTVELAFEDHRSWDLRRWKVATEALSRPIYGMQILNDGNGGLTYNRKITRTRVFDDKMYLYPIPEEEIWKTGMENNPGW